MKSLFLGLFGFFFCVCFVRFVYGLQSNTIQYSLTTFLNAMPDIKEDFSVFMEGLSSFALSVKKITASFGGGNIFDILKSFFLAVGSFLNVFVSLAKSISIFATDVFDLLDVMFDLLFGEVVYPITAPKV